MMRKMIKNTVFIAILAIFCCGTVHTAWSNVTFVKPNDVTQIVDYDSSHEVAQSTKKDKRARAPEPSTLALFGSGFLGMIMTFLRRMYALLKRILDIAAALLGFVILSPLLLITAILVKTTSRGPMIYSQIRVGENGKHFRMYKFRTMRADAEKGTGPVWAKTNDNRLTPVGGFLRKAHIDELPQLVNILKGEMSLIGPRPERPLFVDKFKEVMSDYEQRLNVKPGLTGLAQVRHRYDETIQDVKKKLKYDLLYIRKMCFWADFQIVMRTFKVVATGEGAK